MSPPRVSISTRIGAPPIRQRALDGPRVLLRTRAEGGGRPGPETNGLLGPRRGTGNESGAGAVTPPGAVARSRSGHRRDAANAERTERNHGHDGATATQVSFASAVHGDSLSASAGGTETKDSFATSGETHVVDV